jgi:TonB family protein
MRTWAWFLLILGVAVGVRAQVPEHDAEVDLASEMIGKALFLRCFCAEDVLSFDEQGRVQGQVKTADWTLSGVNVLKVERKGTEIELDGVRVAIRYATDRHEFDRHPQNDDKMRLTIADKGDAAGFARALNAVFATGIDRGLQLSMPEAWQHYFVPGAAWPQDGLTGQVIENVPVATATASVVGTTHKADAEYTMMARRDRVTGSVRLRFVVDSQGVPQRIAIAQPLGYGLDISAALALAKYRFTPAKMQGKAVASNVSIDQEFALVAAP